MNKNINELLLAIENYHEEMLICLSSREGCNQGIMVDTDKYALKYQEADRKFYETLETLRSKCGNVSVK